jgi:alanyl-tRNA synthetase
LRFIGLVDVKMVKIKVDMERREKLKRLHTATHILNFAAREVLGSHVWQNGSHLKENEGTLDITHFESLSLDEILLIEKIANMAVFANKKVKIEEVDRTEAERRFGYTLYQGGAVPLKTLRVVSVESDDHEACGGLHMESTGGIGLIKIIESQKISDGVVRLRFVVNEYALDVVAERQRILSGAASSVRVIDKRLGDAVMKMAEEFKVSKKENERLKDALIRSYLSYVKSNKLSELVLSNEFDMKFLMELFVNLVAIAKTFKLDTPKFVFATPDVSIKGFSKEIKKGKFNIYVK